MFIDLPPSPPAIIRPGEPWEHQVGRDLARAGLPIGARLAVLDELRRLRDTAGLIQRSELADLSRWSGVKLAMLPGMVRVIVNRVGPPVVANTATFTDGTNTTHAVTLPASIAAGDLLFVFMTIDAASGVINTPSGWTQLYQGGISQIFGAGFYKTASGSEGATVSITSTSSKSAATSYRITGWSGTPQVSTIASGTSANPDPSALAPSWGSLNTLFIATMHSGFRTVSGFPSGYSNGISAVTSSGSGANAGSAERAAATASENPASFTQSSSDNWVAYTVGVKPG